MKCRMLTPGSLGSRSGLEIHLEIQCLFRKTLQVQTQVFCLFAQGLPLCQLPSDRTTKEYLRNLKSCLGELGVLSKKTQRHKENRKVVFKSSKNCCQLILLLFAEPFQCTGYCARGFIYIYVYNLIYGEGNGTPLQYSCLENPMDGGSLEAAVHWVAEGRAQLSDFPFTFHFHALEKEMATHSSVLAWRIPGMGEPGGLPSGVAQSQTRLK